MSSLLSLDFFLFIFSFCDIVGDENPRQAKANEALLKFNYAYFLEYMNLLDDDDDDDEAAKDDTDDNNDDDEDDNVGSGSVGGGGGGENDAVALAERRRRTRARRRLVRRLKVPCFRVCIYVATMVRSFAY